MVEVICVQGWKEGISGPGPSGGEVCFRFWLARPSLVFLSRRRLSFHFLCLTALWAGAFVSRRRGLRLQSKLGPAVFDDAPDAVFRRGTRGAVPTTSLLGWQVSSVEGVVPPERLGVLVPEPREAWGWSSLGAGVLTDPPWDKYGHELP